MRTRPVLLAAIACLHGCFCAAVFSEEFYLKSQKTERLYGPYEYAEGAEVTLGKLTFEIVRKEAPPAAAPVDASQHAAAEAAALKIAVPWLALVDAQQFDRAWQDAASYLKDSLKQDAFVESLNAVQNALGGVKSRSLQSAQYVESLPSAPDGQYVILQYSVVLERKQSATETVIPMLDTDGVWRVSGYYLR